MSKGTFTITRENHEITVKTGVKYDELYLNDVVFFDSYFFLDINTSSIHILKTKTRELLGMCLIDKIEYIDGRNYVRYS